MVSTILRRLVNCSQATIRRNMASKPNCRFKYLLILDFEATCDRDLQPQPQEIIEFPCLKYNSSTNQIESQFHEYVKPVENPILSSFCSELTGILQSTVANQPTFHETMHSFDSWLTSQNLKDTEDFAFVTCGDWDIKSMLNSQCQFYGMSLPTYFNQWINLKRIFHRKTGKFPKGMMQMLQMLDLEHCGKHHSGIDDTKNIANIVTKLLNDNATFGITTRLKI